MNDFPRMNSHADGGGAGGSNPRDRHAARQHSSDEVPDPFFKDPALTVGEDVAKSLRVNKPDPGSHEVIHDGYTAEVPYQSESVDYDGSSYGGQMERVIQDRQRESDSRPKGINAREIEAIYGKRWRSDDSLTMNEGPPKKSFSVWNIPGFGLLIKLLVLGAIVLGIFAIRLSIVDEDGMDTTSPLPIWIYQQMTMNSDQQMMQRLEPHERQFALTLLRIRRVADASARYELAFGIPPPSVEHLLNENLILWSRVADGWGNYFRIETPAENILVRSAGKDAAFQTDDDITIMGNSPPHYSKMHYSREAGGTGGVF